MPDWRGGWICVCRRSASPLWMREEKSKWRAVDSEADFANSRLAMDKAPTRIVLRGRDRLLNLSPRAGRGRVSGANEGEGASPRF
jgi:hypothetical protein